MAVTLIYDMITQHNSKFDKHILIYLLTSDTSDSLTDVFFISQVTRSDTIQL